ncbi:MAG: hypothetical protein JRH18_20755 [Deltaproteobacteria bacterium]|nr:hypothetical protein [Deltaproteobacteria bacterium]MBW2154083.1 hypothetical protein [Deltaproteobacteria bacterium]
MRNLSELEIRFGSGGARREYLCALGWPDGFRGPRYNGHKAWSMKGGLFRCVSCDYKCITCSKMPCRSSPQPMTRRL